MAYLLPYHVGFRSEVFVVGETITILRWLFLRPSRDEGQGSVSEGVHLDVRGVPPSG